MRTHSTMTHDTFPLPRGGILEIYREGPPPSIRKEPRPRPFTVQHSPKRLCEPEACRFFHSKSTLPQVAVDYLGLAARIIRPELILLAHELSDLWAEKVANDGELAKIKVEVAR